jgi:hypothetical protein
MEIVNNVNEPDLKVSKRILVDKNYIAKGILKNIVLEKDVEGEDNNYDRYVFTFGFMNSQSKQCDYDIVFYTGTKLNPEPQKIINDTRGSKKRIKVYNRLTEVCNNLKFIDVEKLDQYTTDELKEIQNMMFKTVNLKITAKITRNKNGFYEIDEKTLRLEN